jgi:hypothetical protein
MPEATDTPTPTARDVRILVLPRGWVLVGDYCRDGDEVVLTRAAVVRTWGTTRGLGEIAAGGPTKATKLDPCPEVRAPLAAVVMTIACDAAKWDAL